MRGVAVKEHRNRYAQDACDVVKPARADPVRPFFVFLDLLERYAESGTEIALGHPEQAPVRAHARPDLHVHHLGGSLRLDNDPLRRASEAIAGQIDAALRGTSKGTVLPLEPKARHWDNSANLENAY